MNVSFHHQFPRLKSNVASPLPPRGHSFNLAGRPRIHGQATWRVRAKAASFSNLGCIILENFKALLVLGGKCEPVLLFRKDGKNGNLFYQHVGMIGGPKTTPPQVSSLIFPIIFSGLFLSCWKNIAETLSSDHANPIDFVDACGNELDFSNHFFGICFYLVEKTLPKHWHLHGQHLALSGLARRWQTKFQTPMQWPFKNWCALFEWKTL